MMEKKPTLLIVSSDLSKYTFLKKILRDEWQVKNLEQGKELLETLQKTDIDLILLDHKLEKSSLDLAKEIRKIQEFATLPIILITGTLKMHFIDEALRAGITDFVGDPLEMDEVLSRLAINKKHSFKDRRMVKLAAQLHIPSKKTISLEGRFLLNDRAVKEIAKAQKGQTALSLLMIELDHLSEITKKLGDLTVEELLYNFLTFLNQKIRKQDLLIPLGSGKFIIIFPKTSQSAANMIADDIRSAIHQASFPTKKGKLQLTISMGLVTLSKEPTKKDPYERLDYLLFTVTKELDKSKKRTRL